MLTLLQLVARLLARIQSSCRAMHVVVVSISWHDKNPVGYYAWSCGHVHLHDPTRRTMNQTPATSVVRCG